MIKIIIDSGSDTSAWLEANYDYGFIPLSLAIEGKTYLDHIDIQTSELIEKMKAGIVPKTSQVSPGVAQEVIEGYRQQGHDVLYISIWKELSGTYSVINQIKAEYAESHPEFNIAVVDSLSGSVAGTNIAIQAMELANKGASFAEVVAHAEEVAQATKIFLTVNDMSWLVKGGRLPKAVGVVGTALNVKPILTVNDHEIYNAGLVRGQKRVYKRLVQEMQKAAGDFTDQLFLISHVDQEEAANTLAEQIRENIPGSQTAIFEFGSVLATHIGIGGLAVACLNHKPENYQYIQQ